MKPTLLIIEGDGLLTRAHYGAGADIVTKSGMEVGSVNKFIQVLQREINRWNADYLYIAFDPMGPTTWRHKAYTEYKAGRPPKPPSLVYSKTLLMKILPLLGATIEMNPEFEADDLVGSMAYKCSEEGRECVLEANDKDLLDLLKYKGVRYVTPFPSGSEPLFEKDVVTKMGVRADQVIDYLALLGDTADNVPGVKGCGAMKSSMLLKEYGTLEHIIDAAQQSKIAGALGTNIRQSAKHAIGFRDLMKLRLDSSAINTSTCIIRQPVYNELLPLLQENNLILLYEEALAESRNQ